MHRLHYVEWGRRTRKRATICVHGYSGNARDFDDLARVLAPNQRVVCPDVAGRGDSDWLATPLHYHFGQFAADLSALIAHLQLEEVDWVGTSMGGLLGMMLAARPGSRIRRLVLNDIGGFIPGDALREIGRHLEGPREFATLAEVESHFRRTRHEWGDLPDSVWRHYARHGSRPEGKGYRLHYDPQIAQVATPIPLNPGFSFWDSWFAVRCPVLLLRGESSTVLPPEVAGHMIAVKPQARLVEIAGCGHVPALATRDQIDLVREFLGEPARTARKPKGAGLTMPA